VIYAIIVEQDVGKLLLAGFIPGIFSALIYAMLVIGLALTLQNFGPRCRASRGANAGQPAALRCRSWR
jgi:C4-dicarboxylate transporter DctM subunit